jgi:hypothetical protein
MAITEYIRNMDRAMLNTVFENTVRRANECLQTGGARGNSDGIATRYGQEGPKFESRLGEISAPLHIGPVAHPASYRMCTGGKAAGAWR